MGLELMITIILLWLTHFLKERIYFLFEFNHTLFSIYKNVY